jgi:putative addiction module component (TIGR02574 family)
MALARRLMSSGEPNPAHLADEAWDREIARRMQRFDAGASKTTPASEVFARLRAISPEFPRRGD